MTEVIKTTFQFKRGTAARWIELNPVLAQGEPGFEYDTGLLKIGDGITPWINLLYVNSVNPEQLKEILDYVEQNFQVTTDNVEQGQQPLVLDCGKSEN